MIVFGNDATTGNKLTVSLDDLHSGCTITGVQGTGKTSVAVNIALEEMKYGASVICLDPSTGADMIHDLVSRMPEERIKKTYYLTIKEDKKLYNKHPFLLNIFGYNNPGSVGIVEQARARNQIFLAFDKLFPASDGVFFQEVLRNIIPLLLDHPTFTIFDIEDFLLNETVRASIIKDIDNFRVIKYWSRFSAWSNSERNKLIGPFLRRLGELLDDPFVSFHIGQKRGLLDIRKAILNGENLFIHLPLDDMPYKIAAPAIGTLIMMQIYAATFSFGDITDRSKRPNFCLIVDEFTKWVYDSGDEFKDLFAFGRKYGISQVLCMQYTGQLDEENLRSIKDGITSAKLMMSLRSTLADGPRLAPLYRGVKRKPTDIYIDVLDRLEKHPNSVVKEFYWHTVRPLQLAAKLHEERTTGALPLYNFGFGDIQVEPSKVAAYLNELNIVLYEVQKNRQQSNIHALVTTLATLTGGIQTKSVDDENIVSRIREAEQRIARVNEQQKESLAYQQRVAAKRRADLGPLPEYQSPSEIRAAIDKEVKQQEDLLSRINYKIGELKCMAEIRGFFSSGNGPFNEDHTRVVNYTDITGVDRKESIQTALERLNKARSTAAAALERLRKEREESWFPKDRTDPYSIKERTVEQQNEDERKDLERRYDFEIAGERRNIRELEKKKKKTVLVEMPGMQRVKDAFAQVVSILSEEPIAADKSEFSNADIETQLQQLPNRQAYAKVASEVYLMNTINLSDPVRHDVITARWDTIFSQTKKKYCRGREEIKQAIVKTIEESKPVAKSGQQTKSIPLVDDDDIIE